ncbi:MAG: hypothetical protein ABI690_30575 [Chloroflexota bacterium]
MYKPPSNESNNNKNVRHHSERQRGRYLTRWLFTSAFGCLYVLLRLCGSTGNRSDPIAAREVIIFGVFVLGLLICQKGIWDWKRWGVYGIAALDIGLPIALAIFAQFNIFYCLLPLAHFGILWLVVVDEWFEFE